MMPPTSIDGTDITGATIDGTDVQEITVDGDTVFTAQTLPHKLSNLVLWYPFDTASYAGMSNYRDDATDGLTRAANTTPFDLDDGGNPGVDSGGGVFDINAGANSDAVDLAAGGGIQTNSYPSAVDIDAAFSVCMWINANNLSGVSSLFTFQNSAVTNNFSILIVNSEVRCGAFNGSLVSAISGGTITTGTYKHIAYTKTAGSNVTPTLYVDATPVTDTGSDNVSTDAANRLDFGKQDDEFDGSIDDARFYNTELSASDIQTIYDNTDPNQNP